VSPAITIDERDNADTAKGLEPLLSTHSIEKVPLFQTIFDQESELCRCGDEGVAGVGVGQPRLVAKVNVCF